MTELENVEVIARAIATADGKNPDVKSHNSFEWWRHYVPHARAALNAAASIPATCLSHNAGEIEAGGGVAIDRVESASRLRQWAQKHFGPWITHSTAKRAIDEILALKESRL